jgi:glycosyltransferase involved in cell wall biosynthesis
MDFGSFHSPRSFSGETVPGLVSVILPVHNRPELLRRAVASVLQQTYPHWELWIVDDGSTDATATVARELVRDDSRIGLLRHEHPRGPGAAREVGRQQARGEFVQYLDSDDRLLPRKLERMVTAFRRFPEASIVYCCCREVDLQGCPVPQPTRPSNRSIESILPEFLYHRFWNTGVPLYRKALLDQAGPWLPLFQEEDWELDVRLARFCPKLAFIDEVLFEWSFGSLNGLSGKADTRPALWKDRAVAHLAVLDHALACGLVPGEKDLAWFARKLFLLARQCAAKGLVAEARSLHAAALRAAGANRFAARGMRGFALFSRCFGWQRTGRWAEVLDRWRFRRRRGG